jgi:VanZ family protein
MGLCLPKKLLPLKYIPGPFITGVSFYLSSLSVLPSVAPVVISDKLIHLVCFTALSLAWSLWFGGTHKTTPIKNMLILIVCVSLYGAFDEFHQSFTPGREVSFFDWLADTAGGAIGAAMYEFYCCVQGKVRQKRAK